MPRGYAARAAEPAIVAEAATAVDAAAPRDRSLLHAVRERSAVLLRARSRSTRRRGELVGGDRGRAGRALPGEPRGGLRRGRGQLADAVR